MCLQRISFLYLYFFGICLKKKRKDSFQKMFAENSCLFKGRLLFFFLLGWVNSCSEPQLAVRRPSQNLRTATTSSGTRPVVVTVAIAVCFLFCRGLKASPTLTCQSEDEPVLRSISANLNWAASWSCSNSVLLTADSPSSSSLNTCLTHVFCPRFVFF